MTQRSALAIVLLTLYVVTAEADINRAREAQDDLERAARMLEFERYALARSYLDPLVTNPWLTTRQRARVYYLRGFAWFSEGRDRSAIEDFRHAIDNHPNHTASIAALADAYTLGRGVPQHPAEAYSLHLKAARGGHAPSKVAVGVALQTGNGTPIDFAASRFWLREAAEDDHEVSAYVPYARLFREGFTDEPDPATALAWYRRAEDFEIAEAATAIGYVYAKGELGATDLSRARSQFEKGAQRGDPQGALAAAALYLVDAIGADLERASVLYRQAADGGLNAGLNGLGYLAELDGDVAAARGFYEEAASANDVEAQYRVGQIYLDSSDLADKRRGLAWLTRAGRSHRDAANLAAWILSTSPIDALRDGAAALRLLDAREGEDRSIDGLDTLAASHAEVGDFDEAIRVQRQVVAQSDDADFADRLRRYEARRPWRDDS